MQVIKLDGACRLHAYKAGTAPQTPNCIRGDGIPSNIPGNVEIDLMNAGLLPDIYKNDNVEKTRAFELYEWWYVKEFDVERLCENTDKFLVFDGVDTYAEYYLNGEKIGESDNMLIQHEFLVENTLRKGKNQLAVHIFSALKKSEDFAVAPSMVADWECFENIRCRKPAHMYGWDIFPRVISAGIWRSVRLEFRPKIRIENVYLSTVFVRENLAGLCFHYEMKMPAESFGKYRVELSGKCKESSFAFSYPLTYKAATKFPYVENPLLWWPNGAGEQNLYDVTVRLYDENNAVADEKKLSFGIRYIRIHREDFVGENGFKVYVNNQEILCKGANWVPLDVLHAKDAEKYEECVLNYVENHSNMLRVWGGGVYEDDAFFDLCDKYGIMVWHDFALSCHAYPQDKEFCDALTQEAKSFIRRVRNHTSLALYCGSNETDWVYFCTGQNPNDDVLTRKILPEAIRVMDPYRGYYPTTPLFTEEFFKQRGGRFLVDLQEIELSRIGLPEEHYWWHRDDYEIYGKIDHCFIGESGYAGCMALESLKDCMDGVDTLCLENEYAGDAWKCHQYATDGDVRHATKYYFGELPDNIEDFVLSSQISQGEAYKYLVECTRLKKPRMSGLLIWNMRDGWPAYNSAIVDYYGRKKLAYHYVRQAQQPLTFILSENMQGFACNDAMQSYQGEYTVSNVDGKLLKTGKFSVGANENVCVGDFADLEKEKYLILQLKVGETSYYNHFVCGKRTHDFAEYKNFLAAYGKKVELGV